MKSAGRPNVILIIVDALRKDYAGPLEARLERLGFVSYENAIAAAAWTIPSHASMFSGLYPLFHGAHERSDMDVTMVKIEESGEWFTRRLSTMGYETFFVSANPFLHTLGRSHFNRFYAPPLRCPVEWIAGKQSMNLSELKRRYNVTGGLGLLKAFISSRKFALLIDLVLKKLLGRRMVNRVYMLYLLPALYLRAGANRWPLDKGASEIIRALDGLLGAAAEGVPKLLFINMMEVHEPYSRMESREDSHLHIMHNLRTGRLNHDLARLWQRRYPQHVDCATERVLELMEVLRQRGAFDSSLIIVAGDHGQLLGEHGRLGHGFFLYDELLRVPLCIRYPSPVKASIAGSRPGFVSLTRLKPLVMELVERGQVNDSLLYSDTVFAEHHGLRNPPGDPGNETQEDAIREIEKYRIAIYHRGFRGIFNVADWRFDEIASCQPGEVVTAEAEAQMKSHIVRFLKAAVLPGTAVAKL